MNQVTDLSALEGTSCNDETHVHGCPGRAGGDHIVAKAFCSCRLVRFETETAAIGAGKCSNCHTFARDHEWNGDEQSDFRCYDCDVRYGSHGGPAYGSRFAASPVIPVAQTLTLETAGYIANGEVTIVYEREDPSRCAKCGEVLEQVDGFYATCGDCFGGKSEAF